MDFKPEKLQQLQKKESDMDEEKLEIYFRKMSMETQKKKIDKIIPKLPEPEKEQVTLELPDGKIIKLPLLKPVLGPSMIDIRKLYQQCGHFTYDPGFTATGSCASTITYIDGAKGELRYRGYDIKDLAENSTFMEVCYLLIYGELPDQKELTRFESLVVSEMIVHQKLMEFYKGFQKDAHPMAILIGVVGGGASFMADNTDIKDPRDRENIMIKVIAKTVTISAYAFRTHTGLPLVSPKKNYSYIKNFLYMMFSNPMESEFNIDPRIIRALEVIFIIHADHEQNASTSTVRIAGSSYANPYAVLSSGIASLWGPAHGGANEAVLNMLRTIGTEENIPEFIQAVKNKTVRLMGFGHRVYKNFDPRAQIMKKMCHQVLQIVNKQDSPLLKLAMKLEEIALSDEYFIQRKLYPNVDFYTGIVYEAIDIPQNMFTVLFATSRSIGWISQWNEQIAENLQKIGRPRQLYVGNKERKFVPIRDRTIKKESQIQDIKKLSKLTNLALL